MDIADIANRDTELQLDKRIAAARGIVPIPGEAAAGCTQCSDPIDEARRRLGYSICIYCAERNESVSNRFW